MTTYSDITPYINEMAEKSIRNNGIRTEMYDRHHVFRGLRDVKGNGVVTGLTEISTINAFDNSGEKPVPIDGQLFYRGIPIEDIVLGFEKEGKGENNIGP